MFPKDFELFRQKYQDNCFTKSANNLVLKLYSSILKNETVDSDVWIVGGGFEDIHRILFDFEENDFNNLNNDIINWTPDQIEIFCNGLLFADYYIGYSKQKIDNLENRFLSISRLLRFGNFGPGIGDNIEDFLKLYFSKINAKDIKVINGIKELKKWNDNNQSWTNSVGEAVDSPFTEIIETTYKEVCG